jgi:hypothetical protein
MMLVRAGLYSRVAFYKSVRNKLQKLTQVNVLEFYFLDVYWLRDKLPKIESILNWTNQHIIPDLHEYNT